MEIKLKPSVSCSDENVSVVLGGAFVNALHIMRALSTHTRIIAINHQEDPGLYSKYVDQRFIIESFCDEKMALTVLISIGKQLRKKGVIFPTSDFHVKLMAENSDLLGKYYFLPVNPDSVISLLFKEAQYKLCADIGVPFPKTFFIKNDKDIQAMLEAIDTLMYPLIIKPSNSVEGVRTFKVIEIQNKEGLLRILKTLIENLEYGFVVSEKIPGEPDNIWIYIGYCNNHSKIIAGWTARKLTQRPYYLGVFSTARYEKNEIVSVQGKALLEKGKYIGIGEPEFKYDVRDNKYKLIEINPRYMMFHGVGVRGGINLPLIHYYHRIGDTKNLEKLNKIQGNNKAHLVFMFFEIMNVLDHRPITKYLKNLFLAFFRKNKIWGIFDFKDLLPTIMFFKFLFFRISKRIFSEVCSRGN